MRCRSSVIVRANAGNNRTKPDVSLLPDPFELLGHLGPPGSDLDGAGANVGKRGSLSLDARSLGVLAVRIEER